MNFRLTFALVIVLLLVLSGYIWFTRWESQATKEEPGAANAVFSPKPGAISAISYKEDNADHVAFAKNNNAWTMTYPVTAPVETWRVEDIANTLASLSFKEKFEPEASGIHSPQTTGTQNARYVIAFTEGEGKQEKQHTVALGNQTVGGIYATIDGGSEAVNM